MCEITTVAVPCIQCNKDTAHKTFTVSCKNSLCDRFRDKLKQQPMFPTCDNCFISLKRSSTKPGCQGLYATLFETEVDTLIESIPVKYKARLASSENDKKHDTPLEKRERYADAIFGSVKVSPPSNVICELDPESQVQKLCHAVLDMKLSSANSKDMFNAWVADISDIVPASALSSNNIDLAEDVDRWEDILDSDDDDDWESSTNSSVYSEPLEDVASENNCDSEKKVGKYPSSLASPEFVQHMTPYCRRFYLETLLQDPEFSAQHSELSTLLAENQEVQMIIRLEQYQEKIYQARYHQQTAKDALLRITMEGLDKVLTTNADVKTQHSILTLGKYSQKAKADKANAIVSLLFGLEGAAADDLSDSQSQDSKANSNRTSRYSFYSQSG
ncbi:hypothetical protein BROUX41_004661 [Berkeleyomyces rouxiae]|uniref:uncharacterized protein n=1 Tax=Berkeleyomyces rouxiae TaxID=2035830 RepID=UPI003B7FEEE5